MRARPVHALAALAAGMALALAWAVDVAAQVPASPAAARPASAAKPPAAAASHPGSRAGRNGAAPRLTAGPSWRELSPGQQQALAPLSAQWDSISEAQKRKWIALSANFPKLSAEEQAKLHSRMTEWVGLSAQQRSAARLNFGETRKLSADDKKAKWEAYQALSPEEKKKLAAGVQKPPATAAAVRPVPREKLASVPGAKASAQSKTPRIAAAPDQVDHNTLLPQQQGPIPDGGGSAN